MKHLALFAGLICLGIGLIVLTKTILSWRRTRLPFEKNAIVVLTLLLGFATPATILSYFFFNDEPVLQGGFWRGLGLVYELLRPVLLILIAFFVARFFWLIERRTWRRFWLFIFWGAGSVAAAYHALAVVSLFPGSPERPPLSRVSSLILYLLVFYGSVMITAWRCLRGRFVHLNPLQTRYFKRFAGTILSIFLISAAVDAAGFFGYPRGPAAGLLTDLPVFLFLGAGFFLKPFLGVMFPAEDARRPREERFQSLIDRFGISPREREIILLVCQGKSNKEIVDALFISLPTVKDHISNIYRKTGVANRVQLAALFHFPADT